MRETIAGNWKRLRLSRNYSQKELFKATGIPMMAQSNIENGKRATIPMDYCHMLTFAYGMSVEEIVSELLKPYSPWTGFENGSEISDFPGNMVADIFETEKIAYRVNSEELAELCGELLSEKERNILLAHYREGKTFRKIADEYGVTRERIRFQCANALDKLRAKKARLVFYTYDELMAQRNISLPEMYSQPLEVLDLPVRSYNCLRKHGIRTVGDLAVMSRSELQRVRNLGEKSMKNIITVLYENGIQMVE